MKHEKWQTPLCAALLAFVIAFGGISCLVTGFSMEADLALAAVCCAVTAVVFALFFRLRLGLIPLCAGALLLGYLWQRGALSISTETVLFHISDLYDRGYGWGLIRWSDREFTDATLALCVLGSGLAALLSGLLVWGKAGWLCILTGALPLAACMVLTDTVPEVWCLFLLLLGLLLLLLTQRVRSRDARQGNQLTAMLLVPVSLALVLLFTLVPREGYRGQELAQKLEDMVKSWFEDPLEWIDVPEAPLYPGAGGEELDATLVRLDNVGPKDEQWSMIMKVKAQENGYLYLRGCTYNTYLGTTWSNSEGDNPWPYEQFDSTGKYFQLKISTHKLHGVLYDTYVPVQQTARENGRVENTQEITEYTVDYLGQVTYDETWEQINDGTVVSQQGSSQYLYLPWEASRWARQVLTELEAYEGVVPTNAADAWHLAESIVKYVRQSAVYDLNTPQMPEDETDFASWFMEESDTGYCVHFATAAAVLLRQAGIPARYVTGYLVKTVKDQQVTVRAKDAHAWVECYIAGIGWVVMEPTPGMAQTAVVNPQATTPAVTRPQQTQPTQTEPTVTTQEPTAAETTQPGEETTTTVGGVDAPGTGGAGSRSGSPVVLTLLLGVLAVAMILFQWRLRVWLQYQRQHKGRANAQALARWREAERLARLLKEQPEEQLLELAQKARFSRHTLTAGELKQLDVWLAQARKQLRKKPAWQQLLYTLVLAVY